jgi:predicted amidohydrolase YtcJ
MIFKIFKQLLLGILISIIVTPVRADTLVHNVRGVTINQNGNVERFIAFVFDDDGRVKSLIGTGEALPTGVDYAIDGQGHVVLPGMIDSHAHVMGIGFGQLTLDLSHTTSLEETLRAISDFSDKNPTRPWILGRGWNQEKWGGNYPTASALDGIVPDRPVWLERVDGHAGWANSLAMRQAGITDKKEDPPGGKIIRDENGLPTGIFIDNAQSAITNVIPSARPLDRDLALRMAQDFLLSLGVTSVADMGTSLEDWQTFRRAGDTGKLDIRIMSYASTIEAMELIAGVGPTAWLYEDRLRLNGIKLVLDGALGSRGALLKSEYNDDPGNQGLALLDPTELRNLMSRAAMDRFQTAVHAIGDKANEEVLNAIIDLSETYSGDRRWRIEHAQILDPRDIRKFQTGGIIASMQPLHQTSDRLMAEARLGENRLAGAYAWNSVTQNNAKLVFGSDAPVEIPNPFEGIAVAISRVDENGEPDGGWQPDENIGRQDALASYTSVGAFAGFAEGRFGRLIPGEWADFIFVDRDPMLASIEQTRKINVLATWVAGKMVYAATMNGI